MLAEREGYEVIGILSVLEGGASRQVRQLWRFLGTQGCYPETISFGRPHLTFQVASGGNLGRIGQELLLVAPGLVPVEIEIDGAEHFGEEVIYLKVRLTDDLLRASEAVNELLTGYCRGLSKHYMPERWVPHVTLASRVPSKRTFRAIMDYLDGQNLVFRTEVGNVCLCSVDQRGRSRVLREYNRRARKRGRRGLAVSSR